MKRAEPAPIDAATLEAELEWLARVIELRLARYFDATAPSSPELPGALVPPPELVTRTDGRGGGSYGAAVLHHQLDPTERLLMALALAPQLRPQLLDVLATLNPETQRPFTEFGAHIGPGGALLPTVETACFVLAGDNIGARLRALQRLAPMQRLAQSELIHVGPPPGDAATRATLLHGLLQASAWGVGAASMLGVYLLSGLKWQHGWQYGTGMALIALAALAFARQPRWLNAVAIAVALQGMAAAIGIAVLAGSGKLASVKGDWAANIIFVAGGVAIAVLSVMAVAAHRRMEAP